MQLDHSFTVPVGIDEAWRILLDIERIGPCMPGAVIESVDGDDFTGSVKVKLGPINLTYKGKASFVEKDESTHRAVIDARGRDARGNGTAAAKVTATLTESGGETTVEVNTNLDITGKPAQFGRGVMVDVGNKLIGIFADNLAQTIQGGGPAKKAAAPATKASTPAKKATPAAKKSTAPAKKASPPSVKSPAESVSAPQSPAAPSSAPAPDPEEATVPSGDTALADAAPAFAAPSGIPTPTVEDEPSVNGHSSSTPREVEPIDLLQSAGPAVAKRLAPVAAAILAVLLIVIARRRRH